MSRFAGRSLDRVYFIFLLCHIPATLVMDGQAVYPSWMVSGPLEALAEWYLNFLRDPIMAGVFAKDPTMRFMMPFFYLEMFFQLPCFVLGAVGLWKSATWPYSLTPDDRRVWPLLVAYGASTATTLLPVLQRLLFDTKTSPPLTAAELAGLLGCYVPFLAIPLLMAVDLGFRIAKLLGGGSRKNV
ncbi:hypothetical protein CcaverHIS002_0405560 [Cutaneotrichosporon cavernicola]|uniref:Efficient mitochondria targeting-associated protein 19 n=1 Tax=Cutaneotrichosporon cavernicola TaxID=279322 RepID=A0AA48L4C9_9TREE|nr:uncharacterized protein CcaverHIS019_0405560 [Cutaneotrichosporon cavernicola]BEI83952.1 hypothetical protein CcaverHIS002_0405560 [Cutaneotrichosporon cavernicola]BEI91736.1 hypothetical protein CcaverHIS019_0405560 [Cutaneotrichosporon cavernicola]BEI99509.1 hypothetical protein CcaverHIS631_0405520 [Cutaneotrichosporon cavernicola]BEJ07287.1 hypothetical protein CcaverHIS641_0405560 [Cutaneotrichosporon cavernicola]